MYQRNCVEKSVAYIFVNTHVQHDGHPLPYENAQQQGDFARQLLTDVLKFQSVQVFTNLEKPEIIQKLKDLQNMT